jgi:hypothetical protein
VDGTFSRPSRVSKSFSPGTTVETVLRACVKAMGIGEGNLSDFASGAKQGALGTTFPHGTVVSGSASKELNDIVRGAGLEWSIQNGVLQLKKRGEPVKSKVFELSSDSGLIGVPFVEVDATVIPGKNGSGPSKDAAARAGLLNFQTLLIHQLFPGQKVSVKSESFNGGYQIVSIEYVGNTATNDWHCNCKAKPY